MFDDWEYDIIFHSWKQAQFGEIHGEYLEIFKTKSVRALLSEFRQEKKDIWGKECLDSHGKQVWSVCWKIKLLRVFMY